MLTYIIKRLALMIPMFIGITIISFIVIHVSPGEPTDMQTQLNPKVTAEARQKLRERYDLDKPLYIQYLKWVNKLRKLDFGTSFSPDGRPIIDKIKERLPVTLSINLIALVLVYSIAIPLGVLAAVYRGSWFDKGTTILVFTGFATPTFWLALILMMVFGVKLGWLPISGLQSIDHANMSLLGKLFDYAIHLILPVLVIGFTGLAGMSRYARQGILEVMNTDYVRTARAKGLPMVKVIFKHALRNALLPIITFLGYILPGLIGGSVIFETIFGIPGLGQLFYGGVMARDYPLVMGSLVIGAVLTLIGVLISDILYAVVDPRIRI